VNRWPSGEAPEKYRRANDGDLREEYKPIAYLALSQEADLEPYVDVIVRSDLPLASASAGLTRGILGAAPGAAVSYRAISTYVNDSLATDRLMASLSGCFGALAVLIATLGLYGVVSCMVARRKVEIGIRMALGADARLIVRMVLVETGVLLAGGLAIGVPLAVVTLRWAASLLYGVGPWDPLSFAAATGALAFVSLVAAWIPARRASPLAPTIALSE